MSDDRLNDALSNDVLNDVLRDALGRVAEANRRLSHRNAEARALIMDLLPLAERMAAAAEVLMGGGPSEHRPLIDRATEWLRKMP